MQLVVPPIPIGRQIRRKRASQIHEVNVPKRRIVYQPSQHTVEPIDDVVHQCDIVCEVSEPLLPESRLQPRTGKGPASPKASSVGYPIVVAMPQYGKDLLRLLLTQMGDRAQHRLVCGHNSLVEDAIHDLTVPAGN